MKKAAFFLEILLGITLCGCNEQTPGAAEPTEMTASESENNETPPISTTEAAEITMEASLLPPVLQFPESEVTEWFSYPDAADMLPAPYVDSEHGFRIYRDAEYGWNYCESQGETHKIWENDDAILFWNAYFTDLNGDGCPEFCATATRRNPLSRKPDGTFVIAYDIRNQKNQKLWLTKWRDYRLAMEEGKLIVYESPYVESETLPEGGKRGRLRLYHDALLFVPDNLPEMPEPVDVPEGGAVCWFDINDAIPQAPDEDFPENFSRFALTAFPDNVFTYIRYDSPSQHAAISTQLGGEEMELALGEPMCQAYFSDLNADGYPELCAGVMFGSGMVDEHIVVYDIHNDAAYTLWERGEHNFTLSMQEGKLYAVRSDATYLQETPPQTGRMEIADGELHSIEISQ